MPFSQEYLKDYKEKIRQLPLEELYEIMEIIQNDPTKERFNIVKKRIEELTNEPFTELSSEESGDNQETEQGIKNSTGTKPPKVWILALLAIIETCFIVIMIVAKIKAEANSIGLLIDEAFLNSVAQYEYYQTLFKTFLVPSICLGAATGFYAYALYVRTKRIYSSKDYKKIVYPLCLIAMAILFPELSDLPSISSEKPSVYVERVIDKKEFHHKSTPNRHYLYFSSGSRLKVSGFQYSNTKIDQSHFTIYQGNTIIKALPTEKYTLKVQAQPPKKYGKVLNNK